MGRRKKRMEEKKEKLRDARAICNRRTPEGRIGRIDETKGEVNVSRIPRNAIIGTITVPERYRSADGSTQSRLESIQNIFTLESHRFHA